MNLIDNFLQRYAKEYDFYDELARQVAMTCETIIQRSGIRAVVTHRAKKPESLKEKLSKRNAIKKYQNVEQIYKDIVDLSGVRIAIFFPGDRDEIGRLIESEFLTEKMKRFPNMEQKHQADNPFKRRFSGYDAVHYRVRIKEERLEDSMRRYASAQVEIQIASALMHAWAEVEHDLVYKPHIGRLSEEEFKILDELNGLVLSGEIALERLQKAFKKRIAAMDAPFSNQYELAALIRERVCEDMTCRLFMGRMDILLRFLQKAQMDNPQKIDKYLLGVSGLKKLKEQRTVADHVIDCILKEYPDAYPQYIEAKLETNRNNPYTAVPQQLYGNKEHTALMRFTERWIVLTKVINMLSRGVGDNPSKWDLLKQHLNGTTCLDSEMKYLRSIRNQVLFGQDLPLSDVLNNGTETIDRLLRGLRLQTDKEISGFIEAEREKLDQLK